MPPAAAPLLDLTGKTALVTGATSGVGLQMTYALGEAGARLMLVSSHADDLELAVADLQSAGIDARWVAADSTQQAGIEHLVAQTLHRMGDIDILVNYAPDGWASAMGLHVGGYLMLSQQVAQQSMVEQRHGRIINVAPMASLVGQPWLLSTLMQQAATSAITHLTQTLAAQWGPHHITVNTLCPKVCLDHQTPQATHGLKAACLLFASDAGEYITGQSLTVDAGTPAAVGDRMEQQE